jgi:asparagine synthase (glutamine-hydrolysing)
VVEQLQAAVDGAVRKRVPRQVETGVLLSGGLGSTAIAAAARHMQLALPAFTVSFADDEFPEAPFAGRVARLLGVEHHQVTVGTSELASTFDDLVAALGQPVGHPGGLLQIPLAKAARERVRIVLSGDGGEELFGGRMLDGLGRALQGGRWIERAPALLRRWIRQDPVAGADRVLALGIGGADLFSATERARLLRDPALVRPEVRREVLAPFYRGLDTDPVNTALHGFLRSSLVASALTRADRTGSFSGLDVRMPLLDREVVEAAAALPGSVKLARVGGAMHTRWPLKSLLGGVLPAALLDRPKRGLPTPLGSWLAGPGRLFMEDRVRRLREDPLGLWRPEAIDELRRDATRSNAAGNRLWSLFLLDAWLRSLR